MREANCSSKNNGLPSTPSHTMSRTPSSTSPPSSERAKFLSSILPSGVSCKTRSGQRGRAESSSPSRRGQGRVPAVVSLAARAGQLK